MVVKNRGKSTGQPPGPASQGHGRGNRITILGVPVDAVSLDEALARIQEFLEQDAVHQVVTLNAEMVVLAQKDPDFRRVVQQAALVVPDGSGVRLGARILGHHLPERVAGIDLMQALCQRAARQGWRIYFLGAEPGVAKEAARRLQERYPGLVVVGTQHGYFNPASLPEVLARIRESRPEILFVALGAPKQELWLAEHLPFLKVKVGMGVGGSLDVVAGRVKRAPRWMQRLGLEWLFRLLQEPARWRRVMALPRFLLGVLRERLS
ncbi:MAG: WecB/TagA/CpsF family glycosyltransferase [Clostridia bacterium]|nr:WecB/TagA/CpsF family glycosyltransferase [Clostridia bacterium]